MGTWPVSVSEVLFVNKIKHVNIIKNEIQNKIVSKTKLY